MLKYPLTIIPETDSDLFVIQAYDVPEYVYWTNDIEAALESALSFFANALEETYFEEGSAPIPSPTPVETWTPGTHNDECRKS